MQYPHRCFTSQIFSEPCPGCGSADNVFVGHGTTRTCTNCVLSWGEGEYILADFQERDSVLIGDLPADIKPRIADLEADLKAISTIERRLQQLVDIPDQEWQAALDSEAVDNAA